MNHKHNHKVEEQLPIAKPWTNWIPLMIVFGYIFLLTFVTMSLSVWSLQSFLSFSMGYFFVVFSMFKMINLKGFAEGYSQYDLISKKWYGWGYIYPFIELCIGILYLGLVNETWLHVTTIIASAIVVIGVSIELKKHGKFYCACLGTVLKVPLTKVSLAEYLVMAGMALYMLVSY